MPVQERSLPCVEPYRVGDIPGSVRVAVASNEGENLDGHFGNCARFLIYQVGIGECRLVAIRSSAGAEEALDSSTFRAELIRDCQFVFVLAIGGPAAAKVIQTGIYPLKFADSGSARVYLDQLRSKMASKPPPWLAKVMNVPVEDRIRYHTED